MAQPGQTQRLQQRQAATAPAGSAASSTEAPDWGAEQGRGSSHASDSSGGDDPWGERFFPSPHAARGDAGAAAAEVGAACRTIDSDGAPSDARTLHLSAERRLQELTDYHEAAMEAVLEEAALQAKAAAQQHAREQADLAAHYQAQLQEAQAAAASTVSTAQQVHIAHTAAMRLACALNGAVVRRLRAAWAQWRRVLSQQLAARQGRIQAGMWFLHQQQAKRTLASCFRGWKRFTDCTALGLLPPVAAQRVRPTPSPARLMRQLHSAHVAVGGARFVRIPREAQQSHGEEGLPALLLGMVWAGLSATQASSLQPGLVEAVYGDERARNAAHAAAVKRRAKRRAAREAAAAPPDDTLLAMVRGRPWRESAQWGGAGASLAAETRHVHDADWCRTRLRVREALQRKYMASLEEAQTDADSACGQETEAGQRHSPSGEGQDIVGVEGGIPGYGRLALPLRVGRAAAVLFMEAPRVLALGKTWSLLCRKHLAMLSKAWRRWCLAVQDAGPDVGTAARRDIMQRMAAASSTLAASQARESEMEEALGDTMLQLADAQAKLSQLQGSQDSLQGEVTTLRRQVAALQEACTELAQQEQSARAETSTALAQAQKATAEAMAARQHLAAAQARVQELQELQRGVHTPQQADAPAPTTQELGPPTSLQAETPQVALVDSVLASRHQSMRDAGGPGSSQGGRAAKPARQFSTRRASLRFSSTGRQAAPPPGGTAKPLADTAPQAAQARRDFSALLAAHVQAK